MVQGDWILPNLYMVASVGTKKVAVLLSGTLVSIAEHTNLAATQAMQVDENRGQINLKMYYHN